MKWTEGRSKGATSLVKRSAIKSGTIAIGEKVSVVWGKSKKTYNAKVVDDGSGFDVPQQVTRVAAGEDEPLTLELVDPAPEESQQSPHRDRQPALITMVESLVDAVARLEAKVTVQYDQLVTRLAQLQADIDKLRVCEVYTAEESCPAEETLPTPARPGTRMSSQSSALDVSSRSVSIGAVAGDNFATPRMQSPPLQDISNRSVGGGEFLIAQEDVVQCLAACKSRRNLAARLANKLFTTEEKFGSNCRGACGKTALNYLKVKAIFATCSKHYPLDRLETGATAEREMRNAIDEVCRKTKAPVNNENFYCT